MKPCFTFDLLILSNENQCIKLPRLFLNIGFKLDTFFAIMKPCIPPWFFNIFADFRFVLFFTSSHPQFRPSLIS